MVKLLMRFYDVNSGAIRVDGRDVREFRRADLRETFGMVLQDTWLFKGTIMENIRYGRLDASDEESSPPPRPPTSTTSSRPSPGPTRWSSTRTLPTSHRARSSF